MLQFLPIRSAAQKFRKKNIHQAILRLQTNDGRFFCWRWEALDESRPKHIQTRLPAINMGARQTRLFLTSKSIPCINSAKSQHPKFFNVLLCSAVSRTERTRLCTGTVTANSGFACTWHLQVRSQWQHLSSLAFTIQPFKELIGRNFALLVLLDIGVQDLDTQQMQNKIPSNRYSCHHSRNTHSY